MYIDRVLDKSYVPVRWFWFILGMTISAASSAVAVGAWMKTVELNDQAQANESVRIQERLSNIEDSLKFISNKLSTLDGKVEVILQSK